MASIYFSVFLLAQKRWAVADHFIAELADFDFADDEGGGRWGNCGGLYWLRNSCFASPATIARVAFAIKPRFSHYYFATD